MAVCQVTPEPGKEGSTYAASLSLVEDAVVRDLVEGPGNIYCEYPDEASTGSCKAPLMLKSNQQIRGSQYSAQAKLPVRKDVILLQKVGQAACGSRWTPFTSTLWAVVISVGSFWGSTWGLSCVPVRCWQLSTWQVDDHCKSTG